VDKSLILAVAGSGKTSHIVDRLDLHKRTLLLTYTDNNFANLRQKISDRFGYLPENIRLQTYFTFLNSFCYRPYLVMAMNSKGITFSRPTVYSSRSPLTSDDRYVDRGRRVYHNRMARLLEVKGCTPELTQRLHRYYDAVYVDEAQDFGGYDFNLLLTLCGAPVEVLLVGDFHQHTYSTSADSSVNKNLHADLTRYKERIRAAGIHVDTAQLLKSRRCSIDVCKFIREHIGIKIESGTGRSSNVTVVDSQNEVERLHACGLTVKLFYEQHYLYECFSENWGGSKGLDHFQDVCVVLNKTTWEAYKKGAVRSLSPLTRNKLYVACSRARGNLHLAPEKLFKTLRRP
jgi:DNA helicase-2/ATP-dependent DNA helicase PcrA